jgi:glutaredoxin
MTAPSGSKLRSFWSLALVVLVVGGANQAHTLWRQGQLGEQVAALAQPGQVRMLSSTTCAYCVKARQWMQKHQVAFSECFIDTDAQCAATFEAVQGRGTPVLLVGGHVQTGFTPTLVLEALQRPLKGAAGVNRPAL